MRARSSSTRSCTERSPSVTSGAIAPRSYETSPSCPLSRSFPTPMYCTWWRPVAWPAAASAGSMRTFWRRRCTPARSSGRTTTGSPALSRASGLPGENARCDLPPSQRHVDVVLVGTAADRQQHLAGAADLDDLPAELRDRMRRDAAQAEEAVAGPHADAGGGASRSHALHREV